MASRNTILVNRTLYHIGYVTLIASIIWVGIGIYSATRQEFGVDVEPDLLEPINPILDQEIIMAITERIRVESIPMSEPIRLNNSTESATIDIGGAR